MTPDPLPVALPELPTVAWRWPSGRLAHFRIDPISEPKLAPLCVALVRKSDAEAALRAQAEEVAALRADAERLDRLNELLHWDGHGYWLSDICIRERELGQDSCPPPTPQEFREELDAYLAASKQENRP